MTVIHLFAEENKGYRLEGRLLDVCSCDVLCPCWVGEDPDGETCESIAACHIDRETINGIDVSRLTFALLAPIPGNVLKGNWQCNPSDNGSVSQ